MDFIADGSVNLIVTSPPYPMIEMWDELFISQDSSIKNDLDEGKGYDSFNKMHSLLNNTWKECDRVLAEHGFICINIGDATRTLNGEFQLYSNHSKIIEFFSSLGYSVLPDILWRKPSNSPNKFMGSGMYPAGAYVTYEQDLKCEFETVPFERVRRITGYLVGSLDRFNDGKRAEVEDRVKHSL